MHEIDPFERLFDSLPQIHAPNGFRKRLLTKICYEEQPCASQSACPSANAPYFQRYDVLRVSGMLCIAGSLTMFVALRLPLNTIVPQAISIFEALKGVFS